VDTDRKAQTLAANIAYKYDYDLSDLGEKLKENTGMDINYADEVKDLDESVRNAAARDIQKFVDLQVANINMMDQYESDFRTLTGDSASRSKLDFEAAINRINATTVFGLNAPERLNMGGRTFHDSQTMSLGWDAYTPYTTYVDTGSRAWLPS
jgi:hypothetical protein